MNRLTSTRAPFAAVPQTDQPRKRQLPRNDCQPQHVRGGGRGQPFAGGSGANDAVQSARLAGERAEVGNGQAENRGGAVQGSTLRSRNRHPVRVLVSSI